MGTGRELPLACSLDAGDGQDRMRRWQRLGREASPVARYSTGRLEVRFHAIDGVAEELADLAALEARCCAFAQWIVTSSDGQPVLLVTAPAESSDAVASIAAMFGVEDARLRD